MTGPAVQWTERGIGTVTDDTGGSIGYILANADGKWTAVHYRNLPTTYGHDTPEAAAEALHHAAATPPRPAKPPMGRRAFRIPDTLYYDAMTHARARGENLSDVVRDALTAYTRKHGSPR